MQNRPEQTHARVSQISLFEELPALPRQKGLSYVTLALSLILLALLAAAIATGQKPQVYLCVPVIVFFVLFLLAIPKILERSLHQAYARPLWELARVTGLNYDLDGIW